MSSSAEHPAPVASYFELMHRVLRHELEADEAAHALGIDARRLAVYRRSVHSSVRATLEKIYTLLPELLGADAWGALVQDYFRRCAPTHFELNRCGAAFVDYLEERRDAGDGRIDDALFELARLEWAELEAALDEAVIVTPGVGAAVNPTLRMVESSHRVAAWALARRAGAPDGQRPSDGAELALVWRHPATHAYCTLVATPTALFALKVAEEQLGLAQAARAAGVPLEDARHAWRLSAREGLVLGWPASTGGAHGAP